MKEEGVVTGFLTGSPNVYPLSASHFLGSWVFTYKYVKVHLRKGCLVKRLSCCLGQTHPLSEYSDVSPGSALFQPPAKPQPTSGRWWLKYLDLSHLHGRCGLDAGRLFFIWPSPGCCRYLGSEEICLRQTKPIILK